MYYKSLFDTIFNDLEFTNGKFQTDSVQSKGDVYLGKLIVPGVKKENISIKATDKYLSVFVKEGEEDVLLKKFILGGLVDTKAISSKLEDGILEITMPKKEIQETVEVKIS